jgi:hypothetical protein
MSRFLLFLKGKAHAEKRAQQELNDWEHCTCRGSDFYHQKDYKSAILQFEQALEHARVGLACRSEKATFMRYYTLAKVNLSQALSCHRPRQDEVT